MFKGGYGIRPYARKWFSPQNTEVALNLRVSSRVSMFVPNRLRKISPQVAERPIGLRRELRESMFALHW